MGQISLDGETVESFTLGRRATSARLKGQAKFGFLSHIVKQLKATLPNKVVKPKKNQELESLTFGQWEVNTCVAIHSNPIDHTASLKGTDLGEKAGLYSRG